MYKAKTSGTTQTFWVLSLGLAPALQFISEFFWTNGTLTVTAGVLQVWAFFFWIFAFQGMFHLLEDKMPRYAFIGFFIAVLACIGGNNFGVEGIYHDLMGVHTIAGKNEIRARAGVAADFYLSIGLLFPMSLLGVGINLLRTKTTPVVTAALLCIAAVGFPLSAIPRVQWLAQCDAALLLLSQALIARQLIKNQRTPPNNSFNRSRG